MTPSQVILHCAAEAVGAFFIIRLWREKRRPLGIFSRVFWSLVLLIPFVGLILYGFCATDPDEHPYDTDTTSGAAESVGDGSELDHH